MILNLFSSSQSADTASPSKPPEKDESWLDDMDKQATEPQPKTVEPEIEEEIITELPVDVYAHGENLVILVPIVGAKEGDVSVTISDQELSIHKESNERLVPKSAKPLIEECHWGNISRTIELPEPAQAEKTTAKLEDGVLRITVPREKGQQTKVIKVQ